MAGLATNQDRTVRSPLGGLHEQMRRWAEQNVTACAPVAFGEAVNHAEALQ